MIGNAKRDVSETIPHLEETVSILTAAYDIARTCIRHYQTKAEGN